MEEYGQDIDGQAKRNEENNQIENKEQNGNNKENESQNEMHNNEGKVVYYNVDEYFPYSSQHDQYSCLCCEHFYEETIKKKVKLPNIKCEVCGNEINQRSLDFYRKKYSNNKKKGKAKKKQNE